MVFMECETNDYLHFYHFFMYGGYFYYQEKPMHLIFHINHRQQSHNYVITSYLECTDQICLILYFFQAVITFHEMLHLTFNQALFLFMEYFYYACFLSLSVCGMVFFRISLSCGQWWGQVVIILAGGSPAFLLLVIV